MPSRNGLINYIILTILIEPQASRDQTGFQNLFLWPPEESTIKVPDEINFEQNYYFFEKFYLLLLFIILI